jgi:mono/diheme cytochrome c family protein
VSRFITETRGNPFLREAVRRITNPALTARHGLRPVRPIVKYSLFGFGGLAVAFLGLFAAVQVRSGRTHEAPLPELKASTDPAVIARGRELVYGPAHCGICHAPGDRIAEAEKGAELPLAGGMTFALPIGTFVSPNLTPDPETGIGKYSDGEIARALRHGVGPDGRMLFPIMPFQHLSDEDLVAILSYLRSQEPVVAARPKPQLTFLGKVLWAFVLQPAGPQQAVPKSVTRDSSAEYGKYLAESVANCVGCHTDRDLSTGAFVGDPYSGGFVMDERHRGAKVYVTPNITGHEKTGVLARYTEDGFVARMRAGTAIEGTPMPWASFAKMSDDDLRALYRHLVKQPHVEKDTGPSVLDAPPA